MSSAVFIKILNGMRVEIYKFTSIIYSFNDIVYRVFCFIYIEKMKNKSIYTVVKKF